MVVRILLACLRGGEELSHGGLSLGKHLRLVGSLRVLEAHKVLPVDIHCETEFRFCAWCIRWQNSIRLLVLDELGCDDGALRVFCLLT